MYRTRKRSDMVFKAGQNLFQISVSILILLAVCLIMPAASYDIDFDRCGTLDGNYNANNSETSYVNSLTDYDIETHLSRVHLLLEEAKFHFQNIKQEVSKLYSDVKSGMIRHFYYPWLPSKSWDWYRKKFKNKNKKQEKRIKGGKKHNNHGKKNKLYILIPKLRDSLFNFSATFYQMRQFYESPDVGQTITNHYKIRKQLLDGLNNNLTQIWCEVVEMSLWWNKTIPKGPQTVIDTDYWVTNPDHTKMQIQEWGVLITCYRFLKDWLRISNDEKWSKVSATEATFGDPPAANPSIDSPQVPIIKSTFSHTSSAISSNRRRHMRHKSRRHKSEEPSNGSMPFRSRRAPSSGLIIEYNKIT